MPNSKNVPAFVVDTPDLEKNDPNAPGPSWYLTAKTQRGQHEVRGGENLTILRYNAVCTYHPTEDEVAWCSAFVCWCLAENGVAHTASMAAASWLTSKCVVRLAAPRHGCIVVIRQKRRESDTKATGTTSGYHVAFFSALIPASPNGAGALRLYGGNQGDMVKFSTFSLDGWEVAGYFWPRDAK